MRIQLEKSENPRFKTIKQFCTDNPAFTVGGVRHTIFFIGPKIEEAGALVRFGRKRLINEDRWLALTAEGFFSQISGVAR
jgi:hypothetical protein|tara:strand:+ start:51 stop:290 length:240 start_codon:yes stop_codon:yes gene_type:complete